MRPLPRLLLPLLLFTFVPGCVRSLHPIYTDDTLTYDPAFLGVWADAKGEMRIEIAPSGENDQPDAIKSYRVTHTDKDGKAARLIGHLAKVGGLLVADLTVADEQGLPESDFHKAHLVPLHTFWVVRLDGTDTLTVRAIEHDWMKKFVEANPAAVAHYRSSEDVILTAPPQALQKFLLAHVKDDGMLSDVETFRRIKPDVPAPDPATAPAGARASQPAGRR